MTTKRPNTRTLNATQRWEASGFAKPAPLQERLAMLDEIMLRNDLSGTELRVIYYLVRTRTNSETGLCFATDRNIADALQLNIRTIERTKQSLKAKGVLTWSTERLNRKNTVSLFRLTIQRTTGRQTGIKDDRSTGINDTKPDSLTGINSDSLTGIDTDKTTGTKHYAKDGSPELAAWDRWSKKTTGKSLPRDRAGGWFVETQWPPTKQLTISEIFDL